VIDHPDVLENLKTNVNVAANFRSAESRLWLSISLTGSLLYTRRRTRSDIILAEEDDHAQWIKGCVERLLVRPSVDNPERGVFWM
jgi:hypothetical protein